MCSMYSRNYSQVTDVINAENSITLLKETFPPGNITGCLYGWNYDTSVFKSTVVTEVISAAFIQNVHQTLIVFFSLIVESSM